MFLESAERDVIGGLYVRMLDYFSQEGAVLAKDDNQTCYYLSPYNEARCAVGCLLSPEDAQKLMDHNVGSLQALVYHEDVPDNIFEKLHLERGNSEGAVFNYLRGAQKLHDQTAKDVQHFLVLLTGFTVGIGIAVFH